VGVKSHTAHAASAAYALQAVARKIVWPFDTLRVTLIIPSNQVFLRRAQKQGVLYRSLELIYSILLKRLEPSILSKAQGAGVSRYSKISGEMFAMVFTA